MPHVQNVELTPGEYDALKRKADAMDAIMDAEWDSEFAVTVARAIALEGPVNGADFLDLFVTTVVETNPIGDLYK